MGSDGSLVDKVLACIGEWLDLDKNEEYWDVTKRYITELARAIEGELTVSSGLEATFMGIALLQSSDKDFRKLYGRLVELRKQNPKLVEAEADLYLALLRVAVRNLDCVIAVLENELESHGKQ